MLNPGALWVRSLTGASVRMSVVPGVMSARALLRNSGAIVTLLARSGRFGARPPTLAVEIQLRFSTRIYRCQGGVDMRPGKPLDAADRSAPDLHAVTKDIAGAIRCAHDDRHWSVWRLLRRPGEARGHWARLGGRAGKKQARLGRVDWPRFVVRDDNRRSEFGDGVKFRCEVLRQPHTAVRRGIARQLPRVHGDPSPGKSLHVRHLRAFIDARFVIDFLLQNSEHASRRAMACGPSAHRRTPDAYAVSINVHDLVRQTDENDHGPGRRDLRMPEIISGFKVGGEGLDVATFGKIGGASEWQTDQTERSDDDDDDDR